MSAIKNRCIILVAVLALFCGFSAQAQMETRGTDFWLAFARNADHTDSKDIVLQIKIVAEAAATGTIKFVDNPAYNYTFNVPAHGVYTFTPNSIARELAYNGTMNPTRKKSIHIQSDVPVSVYALNEINPSTGEALADATNILPTAVLGTEYYHLGRISDNTNLGNRYDQNLIIATQNGTNIYQNGTPIATNLAAGQVYFHQFHYNNDVSGMRITSNYPVAYFTAHSFCQISGGGDNFFQQLTPVNTWGKNFIVPVTNRTLELVRIVASQDNTTITQTGGTIKPVAGGQTSLTLNAGQWVELEIKLSSNGCYIQSDKPVQVCTYMVGIQYPGAVNTVGGDEAICWVPPIEQRIDTVLISPFAVTNLLRHYALIVTPTETRDNTVVSIGGAAASGLSGGTWYENAASGMSFYNVELTNSTASYLYTNSAGLIAYGYGFGNAISYYYMAGSAMRPLEVAFYVNDVFYIDLPDQIFETHETYFRADINNGMSNQAGRIKWYIDNEEITEARDLITWNKNLPNGIYKITMKVLASDNVTVKTVESTLIIYSPPTEEEIIDDIFVCANTPITLVAQEHNGGFAPSYQWKKNGVIIDGATDPTYTYTPVTNGEMISCDLIYNDPCVGTGTVVSNKIIVNIKPVPQLTSNLTHLICSGDNVNYLASSNLSGATFIWTRAEVAGIMQSEGSGENNYINEVLTNTTTSPIDVPYAITLLANGCSITQNISVTVNPSPSLTSLTEYAIYSGETFTYTATGDIANTAFSWTRAAVAGITQSASSGNSAYINEVLTNTTNNPIHVIYAITMSANGCSNTQNVTVTVDSKPVLSSDLSKIICSGSSVNYTATCSIQGVTFSWTRAAVQGITESESSGNNGNITEVLNNITPHSIDVIYVFTLMASGVTNTQNVTITVNPKPILTSITLDPICSGSSVDFTAGSATSGTTFSWTRAAVADISPSTGSGSGASIFEILTNSSTNPIDVIYAIHLDANGCVNDQNVTVKVNPVPNLTSPTTYAIYSGETFTYTATSNLASTAFSWTRAAVSGITPSTGSGSDASVNEILTSAEIGLKEVVYAFNLTAYGCSNTQDVKVNVLKMPPYFDQYVSCLNNELLLSVPPVSGINFYWYDSPSGGTPLSESSANTITVVNATLPKTYWVEPRTGTTAFNRKEIIVTESEACGGTQLDTACMRRGTLLYSQDFGGNIPPVAKFSSTPLPSECSELPFKTGNFGGGGFYTLTKNASFVWETFHNLGDHTQLGDTSLGFFMLVDPANGDKGKVLYKNTIYDLCDETTLTFSAWFMDVNNEKHVAPKIEMQMLNVNTDAVLVTTGDIQIPYGNSWKQYGFNFTLPVGIDAVTFRILNKENSTTGNDWGMDDIEIHLCVPEVVLHVDKEITSCINYPMTLSGSYNDDGTLGNQLAYRWEYSETGNVNNPAEWSVIDGTQSNATNGKITSSYYIPALSWTDAGYYRLAVGRQGNINKRCRSESDIVKLMVTGFEMDKIGGEKTVCANSSITLTHSMPNGTWVSSNTAVANISNSGVVTGVSAGEVTITYTVQQDGCQGVVSTLITVHALPEIGTISGENSVCVNNTIIMTPTVIGGSWTTSDMNIATVDNEGIVTGVHDGIVKIIYTRTSFNGCTDTVSKTITVLPLPSLGYIDAPASICVGDTITMKMLKTFITGVWTSSDPEIASIDAVTGKITGSDEGTVEIKYVASNGFCVDSITTLLTVSFCIDCHEGGMLLYQQDFGGNDPSDLSPSPDSLATVYSQLVYSTKSKHPEGKGYYNFTKNPYEIYKEGFFNRDDHTHEGDSTRGYMMFVDPYLNDYNKILYQTEITDLCEGVRLYFSAWFTDINRHVHDNAKSPKIELQILDNVTKQPLLSSGTIEVPFGNKWTQIGIPFTLGSNTHGIICRIYNKEASKDGNDLGIDDIEVRFCAPPVTTSFSTIECEGESLTLTGHYIDNGTFGKTLSYHWKYSETGNIKDQSAWTIIEESKGTVTNGRIEDIPFTIDSLTQVHTGYYCFVVGSPLTISSWNCRAISEIVEISVRTYTINEIIGETTMYERDIIQLTIDETGGTWTSSDTSVATVDQSGEVTGISEGTALITYTIEREGCTPKSSIAIQVKGYATLYGTVFPFVNDLYTPQPPLSPVPDVTFNNMFVVTARLYAVPPVGKNVNPLKALHKSKPIKETKAVFYDGTIFVATTPRHPGYTDSINNPGLPINWSALGYTQETVNNATVTREHNIPEKPVGLFTFENVKEGDYILKLSSPGFVSRYAKIHVDGNTSLGHRELIPGDFNNDGLVDQRDITANNARNSFFPNENYDIKYDTNRDRLVDINDIKLLVNRYYGFTLFLYEETWAWIKEY